MISNFTHNSFKILKILFEKLVLFSLIEGMIHEDLLIEVILKVYLLQLKNIFISGIIRKIILLLLRSFDD